MGSYTLKTCINLPITLEERQILLNTYPGSSSELVVYKNNVYDFDIDQNDRETDYLDIERIAVFINNQFIPLRRCRNKNRKKDKSPLVALPGFFNAYRTTLSQVENHLSIGIEDYADACSYISAQVTYKSVAERNESEIEFFREFEFVVRHIQSLACIKFDNVDFASTWPRCRNNFNRHTVAKIKGYRYNYKGERLIMTFNEDTIQFFSQIGAIYYKCLPISDRMSHPLNSIFSKSDLFNVPFEVIISASNIVVTDIRQIYYMGMPFTVPPGFVARLFPNFRDGVFFVQNQYKSGAVDYFDLYFPKYFKTLQALFESDVLFGEATAGYIKHTWNNEVLMNPNHCFLNIKNKNKKI